MKDYVIENPLFEKTQLKMKPNRRNNGIRITQPLQNSIFQQNNGTRIT